MECHFNEKNSNCLRCFPDGLTVLLEPFGGCNLRCRHCYYAKTDYPKGKMSIEMLNRFLQITVPNYKNIKFIWHGGEPLLAGYEFFEKAYGFFDNYNKNNDVNFYYNLQTNGTLLDKNLIRLFKETNTIITISYDGQFNDALRQKTECVEEKIKLLKDCGVEFSCLSTVSSANVKHMIEEYEFFKEKNISVKFNPIIPDGAAQRNRDYLISKEEWTEEFIKLFDYWFYDEKCNINFAPCIEILKNFLRKEVDNNCANGACLFRYIAVDYKGDLYPCGRMIEPDFNMGNVFDYEDIRYAYLNENYLNILQKNEIRMKGCENCKWFTKCHGGCNSEAHICGDVSKRNEFNCYFTRMAFEHIGRLLQNFEESKVNKKAKMILNKYKNA